MNHLEMLVARRGKLAGLIIEEGGADSGLNVGSEDGQDLG